MFLVESRQECVKRDFKQGSVVCVCNATLCDDLDPIKKTAKGIVTVFQSSKDGDRFKESQLKFGAKAANASKAQTIVIDRSKTYQKIIGFGGAFTDASGLNIKSLPEKLQQRIIEDYFSERGIEYTLGRIPIGGSDFSTRAYSYDDKSKDDYSFSHFALAKEDNDYKVPN